MARRSVDPKAAFPTEEVDLIRVDRWAWARAIYDGNITVGLDGIPNQSGRRYHGRYAAISGPKSLGEALTSSSQYMDKYAQVEIDHYLDCNDYDEEWEEFCREKAQDNDLDANELSELIACRDKRQEWAWDLFDPQWAWDLIKEDCNEIWFIYELLKEYPVVALKSGDLWFELGDIIGYCPGAGCNYPLMQEDVRPVAARTPTWTMAGPLANTNTPHPYENQCQTCPSGINCAYDENENPRPCVLCPSCGEFIFCFDDLDGTWDDQFDRPFHWPPGVVYPPRKDFAGGPDGAPPWEE